MPQRRRRFDEVSAGAVVVRRSIAGWETCLIRVGDAWSLPKGIVDAGETPATTALREVAEETGLPREKLVLREQLPASEYAYRRNDGRLVFKKVDHFLVELAGDAPLVPQAEEIDEAAWVPLADAQSKVAYRDLRATLAEARRLLGEEPA